MHAHFTPSNMVLAAAGYEHDQLVSLAEASFGKLPAGSARDAVVATYEGGEARLSAR